MGAWAILLAMICFLAPMAVPLVAQGWRSFLIIVAVGISFGAWMTIELPNPGSLPNILGSFLAGLILIGFTFGAVARFVMLVGKKGPEDPPSAPSDTGQGPRRVRGRVLSD